MHAATNGDTVRPWANIATSGSVRSPSLGAEISGMVWIGRHATKQEEIEYWTGLAMHRRHPAVSSPLCVYS